MEARYPRSFIVVLVVLITALSVPAQDSLNVSTMGQSFFWGSLRNMAAYQDYLYVCDYNAFLWIVDISNPESPQMLTPYKTPHYASDIIIEGNTAFIADGLDGGLVILDLSDPLSPQVIGSSSLIEGYVQHLEKNDTLVVLGVSPNFSSPYESQIHILNVADISNPVIVNSLDYDYEIGKMVLKNNYLYLRTYGSLKILDITDPFNMQSVFSVSLAGFDYNFALEIFDSLLFVDDGDDLAIFSITNPASPQLISHIGEINSAIDIVFQDSIAFVLDVSTVYSFDLTDLQNPEEIDDLYLENTGGEYDLLLIENYICVSSQENGIKIIDNQNPQALAEIGSVDTPSNPYSIFAVDNKAYLANRSYDSGSDGALVVIDVENPYQHVQSGWYDFGFNNVESVFVENNKAYTTDWALDLSVIDISNPDSLSIMGVYDGDWWGISSVVQNDTVYLCNGSHGLNILDASDPQNITLIGEYDSPGSVRTIVVDGNLGYIADGNAGFAVLDLSDVTQPREIGRLDYDGYFDDVDYENGICYITDSDFGLHIVDVSDPQNPEIISSYAVGGSAWSLDYQWDYVYISDHETGLKILDVSDPLNPLETGYYHPGEYLNNGFGYDICVQGEIAYYATPLCFYTLDISQAVGVADRPPISSPFTFTLHPNYPNPFNAQTVIPFTLDGAGKVKIEIFDITGRSVGAFRETPLQSGRHEFVWNAENLASGVYLVRLEQWMGGLVHSQSQKAVLIK